MHPWGTWSFRLLNGLSFVGPFDEFELWLVILEGDFNAGKQVIQQGLILLLLPEQIMIAPYFDVAATIRVGMVKRSHSVVNRRMGDVNLSKRFVFPQFLSIAEFDEGERSFEIVIQGALKDKGIMGEVVGGAAQKGSNIVSMMLQASLSVTIWISFQAIKNQSSLICPGEVT